MCGMTQNPHHGWYGDLVVGSRWLSQDSSPALLRDIANMKKDLSKGTINRDTRTLAMLSVEVLAPRPLDHVRNYISKETALLRLFFSYA